MDVGDAKRRNFRSTQSDLKTNGKHRSVTQALETIRRRRIEDCPRLLLRKCQRFAFPAINGRPLDIAGGVSASIGPVAGGPGYGCFGLERLACVFPRRTTIMDVAFSIAVDGTDATSYARSLVAFNGPHARRPYR
jgi:hypothetical protein